MSAPQFTPGPWKVRRGGAMPSIIAGGVAVCNFGSSRHNYPTICANARLTAASPRLYEMLEKTLDAFERRGFGTFWEEVQEARALLAEVRGDQ